MSFRSSGGKLTGQMAESPMIIITHKGAKSGTTTPRRWCTARTETATYHRVEGGAPNNPSWYHNLVAHPEVTVEIGAEKFKARGARGKGAERDRLFEAQLK